MKIPPDLAEVEGIEGLIRASAKASEYAKPKVLLPKAATNKLATRSPIRICVLPMLKLLGYKTVGPCLLIHNIF